MRSPCILLRHSYRSAEPCQEPSHEANQRGLTALALFRPPLLKSRQDSLLRIAPDLHYEQTVPLITVITDADMKSIGPHAGRRHIQALALVRTPEPKGCAVERPLMLTGMGVIDVEHGASMVHSSIPECDMSSAVRGASSFRDVNRAGVESLLADLDVVRARLSDQNRKFLIPAK